MLPKSSLGKSRVIITTRNHGLVNKENTKSVEVGVVGRETSLEVLLRRTGSSLDDLTPDQREQATKLAEKCRGHLHTLDLCAGMLQGSCNNLERVYQKLEEGVVFTMKQEPGLTDYEYTVDGALQASFDDLKKETVLSLDSISVTEWLERIGMGQYSDNFRDFESLVHVVDLEKNELRDDLGVRNVAHRNKLMEHIGLLKRDKCVKKYDTALQEFFCDLSVFPEDTQIPLSTLVTMQHEIHEQADVEEMIESLASRSLVSVHRREGTVAFVSLHDNTRAFLLEITMDSRLQRHSRLLNIAFGSEFDEDTYLRHPHPDFVPWTRHHVQEVLTLCHGDLAHVLQWLEPPPPPTTGRVGDRADFSDSVVQAAALLRLEAPLKCDEHVADVLKEMMTTRTNKPFTRVAAATVLAMSEAGHVDKPRLREVVLEAVKRDWRALKYASEGLKRDQELVLEVVKQHGYALGYASEGLKQVQELVLEAVKRDGMALEFASEDLKQDREFVLVAVRQNGRALQFASEGLKQDRELVLEAVKRDGWALKFASEGLKQDRGLVLEAVKQNARALEFASEDLKQDRELVLEAVKQDCEALEFASEGLKQDRELVLLAMKQTRWTWKYVDKFVSQALMRDREFMLGAVEQDGMALEFASEGLKQDRELVLLAMKQTRWTWKYVDKFVSQALMRDREFMLGAVEQDGMALKFASEDLKQDRELVLEFVKRDGRALQFASEGLKQDREVVLEAVRQDREALKFAPEGLKRDREFMLRLMLGTSE